MRMLAALAVASAAVGQPILPIEQVFSSRTPAPGEAAFTTTPGLDVSPDGLVVISERAQFGRRVFAATPPEPFAVLARYGFVAIMPDGQRFGVNFNAGWAAPGPVVISNDGEIGLVGSVVGQTLDPFIWTRQIPPGLPEGVRLAWGRLEPISVNDLGLAVVRATLEGTGMSQNNRWALFEVSATGPRLLFRSGADPLNRPGVAYSLEYSILHHNIAPNGRVLFLATKFTGATNNGQSLLVADDDGVRVLLDPDVAPPGFGPDSRLGSLAFNLGINAHGHGAFSARIINPTPPRDQFAVFRVVGDNVRRVFASGDAVQGLPPGVTTTYRSSLDFAGYCPINDFGDIAFPVALAGPGVYTGNDSALVVVRDGVPHLVCREGDPVPGVIGPSLGDAHEQITAVFMNSRRQVVAFLPAPTPFDMVYLSWSPSRGLQTLIHDSQLVTFEGSTQLVQSLPAVATETRGNSQVRSSGGSDGRRTILDHRGHAYLAAAFGAGYTGLYRATLPSPCLADFDNNDFLDFFDYDGFVAAFEAGLPSADADHDGFVDFFDYDRFVGVFEAGCD